MNYLQLLSIVHLCVLTVVGCSEESDLTATEAVDVYATESGDARFRASDPYFARYTLRREQAGAVAELLGLLRAGKGIQLLVRGEYLLTSAARYVTIDGQRYGFVPIMSDAAPMPENFVVLPVSGGDAHQPYRFVDEFGTHNGVNLFFSYTILAGLEADRKLTPIRLKMTTSPGEGRNCREVTVYLYTDCAMASSDSLHYHPHRTHVDKYVATECAGAIVGEVDYSRYYSATDGQ